jgi:hypothetical protein
MQLVTACNGGAPIGTCDDPALQVNNCNIQEYYILGHDANISVAVHSLSIPCDLQIHTHYLQKIRKKE